MAALLISAVELRGDTATDTQSQLRQLQQQNEILQEQLRKQQLLIDSLSKTVKEIQAADANRSKEWDDLKSDLIGKLYGAIRFSEILADKGFPIAGNADKDLYVFSINLTKELWRLSLGLGYSFHENLALKAEYSFERGKTVTGGQRDHEDLFAMEAAFKF